MPVVDASVVVDWVAPDVDPDGSAMRFLDDVVHAGEPLAAPRLLKEEVGNALLTGCRRGRWSGADADRAFELVQSLPVRLVDDDADLARAWELSRRYDQHPIYDMLYVAVAERLGQRLVTADLTLASRVARLGFVTPLSEA